MIWRSGLTLVLMANLINSCYEKTCPLPETSTPVQCQTAPRDANVPAKKIAHRWQ
jgi:hypothetical protein